MGKSAVTAAVYGMIVYTCICTFQSMLFEGVANLSIASELSLSIGKTIYMCVAFLAISRVWVAKCLQNPAFVSAQLAVAYRRGACRVFMKNDNRPVCIGRYQSTDNRPLGDECRPYADE